MKVFLSYSFDKRDKPITDPFISILSDLGVDILEGKGLSPDPADQEVIQRISRAHALVGIISAEWDNKSISTLPKTNIVQEIAVARTLDKDLLLFVEKGLDKVGFIDNNCLHETFTRDNLSKKVFEFKDELDRVLKTRVDPRSAKRDRLYVNRFSSKRPEISLIWGNRNEVPDLAGGQAVYQGGGMNNSGCLIVVNTSQNWNWRQSKSIVTLGGFGTADGLQKNDEIYFYCRLKAFGNASMMPILSGGWGQDSETKERKWINLRKFKENPVPDSEGEWDEYFLKERIYSGEEFDIKEKGHPLHLVTDTGSGIMLIDEIEFGILPSHL